MKKGHEHRANAECLVWFGTESTSISNYPKSPTSKKLGAIPFTWVAKDSQIYCLRKNLFTLTASHQPFWNAATGHVGRHRHDGYIWMDRHSICVHEATWCEEEPLIPTQHTCWQSECYFLGFPSTEKWCVILCDTWKIISQVNITWENAVDSLPLGGFLNGVTPNHPRVLISRNKHGNSIMVKIIQN